MKEHEVKQPVPAGAELDAALARMAEEVPPMPADFHDRWMNAVRSEARGNVSAEEESAPKNTESIVRWTRILSVAAAFVFLIGGTLLYRNSKKSLSVPYAPEKREAEVSAAGSAAEEADEAADAAVYGNALSAGAEEPLMMDAYEAPVLSDEAAVEEAEEAWEAEEPAEAEYAAKNAVYNAAPAVKKAPAAAPEPAPTSAPTSEPEPADMSAAEEVAEAEEAPEAEEVTEAEEAPAEETGFLQEAGAFFTDMGDFLLAALPYLLVLAVPAVTALVIRRKKAGKS